MKMGLDFSSLGFWPGPSPTELREESRWLHIYVKLSIFREAKASGRLAYFSLPSTFLPACCLPEILWGLMRQMALTFLNERSIILYTKHRY